MPAKCPRSGAEYPLRRLLGTSQALFRPLAVQGWLPKAPQVSARPVGNVVLELALIERPRRLFQDKFGVRSSELFSGSGWIVGAPLWFSAGHVMQLTHDAVGGYDV
jgi:hypothetical protein